MMVRLLALAKQAWLMERDESIVSDLLGHPPCSGIRNVDRSL